MFKTNISPAVRCFQVFLALLPHWALATTTLNPQRDDEVLEILPVITRNRAVTSLTATEPAKPETAALAARQDIGIARQTGDTRYWGRAQAVLAPWWDRADAPADIAVLQATVQQGRHEFEASRKVLTAALARAPGHAQGWLNLAALERLSARYDKSLEACDAVARAGAALYAKACRLETQSLQGLHQASAQGLAALLAQASDKDQRAWLLSLLAESHERAGQDRLAAEAFEGSLALETDLYTSIAYSDLLLRTGKFAQALKTLDKLPETDAVLLRRARAWRTLGDPQWMAAQSQLHERTADLRRRGDNPELHGRELALIALWLDDDAVGALALARRNLELQREPVDWWVALQCAQQAGDKNAGVEIADAIRAAGLQDVRLSPAGQVKAASSAKTPLLTVAR
jgi:tetratricopeptide (TPR) repeat protein